MQGRRTNWSSLFFGLVFLGVAALLLSGPGGCGDQPALGRADPAHRHRPLPDRLGGCGTAPPGAQRTPGGAPEPLGRRRGDPRHRSLVLGRGKRSRGIPAPVPAQEPGGGAEPDDPGDASAPGDPPSPAG